MSRSALNTRALKATLAAALLATGIGVLVTSVRLLPIAADGGWSWLSPLFLAGGSMAAEASLLVAPSLGWGLALAQLSDRGELRALQSLGASPFQLAVGTAPSLATVLALGLVVSFAWGGLARSPGTLLGRVIDGARTSCVEDATTSGQPAAVDLPLLSASWVCFPTGAAWVVGHGGEGDRAPMFASRDLRLSPDMSALLLTDAVVTSDTQGAPGGKLRVSARAVTIAGADVALSPSNLSPASRAILLAATSTWLAWLGCVLGASALARRVAHRRARPLMLSAAACGGAGAALTFSSLEASSAMPLYMYVAVPLVGSAALFLAHGAWRAAVPLRR